MEEIKLGSPFRRAGVGLEIRVLATKH
jgi:hypothetical protein